jgi:hypothetical protein
VTWAKAASMAPQEAWIGRRLLRLEHSAVSSNHGARVARCR